MDKFTCIIHGGAGDIKPAGDDPAKWQEECHQGLKDALQKAGEILGSGGKAVDAVIAAVRSLEDNPHFNAGRGAVLTAAGTAELDASVMDGRDGAVGAVTNIKTIKNPVLAAEAVMLHSPHTLMAGEGAEELARQQQLEVVTNEYFYTKERQEALAKVKSKAQGAEIGGGVGTVGAVALDRHGNLAAATSTGGLTNKRLGRVSDSACIGAGTYAENNVVAISCTGTGDIFIRRVAAFDVAAMVAYQKLSLEEAVNSALQKVGEAGGSGGMIAVGPDGSPILAFTDPDMFRGYLREDGTIHTAIFGSDTL